MNTFLVSVCCISYNHEQYVQQTLDGFLMQQTDFKFEIVISDDCSSDKTHAIIKEYKGHYPTIIRDVSPVRNLGISGNFTHVLNEAKGKYIALCEGDDCWSDPYKLQKQVDFLEMHEDYVMCYTDYNTVDNNGSIIEWSNHLKNINRSHSGDIFKELLRNNYIQTLTVVFRKKVIDDPEFVGGIDYALFLQCALLCKCHFMNLKTGCYRLQENSAIHTLSHYVSDICSRAWRGYVNRYMTSSRYKRSLFEHMRICGTICASLISKMRSGVSQKREACSILQCYPELKKYWWLGVFYKVNYRIKNH